MRDYQAVSVTSRRVHAQGNHKATTGFPGTLEPGQAQALLDDWLRRMWFERDTVSFAVAKPSERTSIGAAIVLPGRPDEYVVTEVEDGVCRRVQARKRLRSVPGLWTPQLPPPGVDTQPAFAAQPLALLLDLPLAPGFSVPQEQLRLAVWQRPWRTQSVLVSPETTGFEARMGIDIPATVGTLVKPLASSFEGRFDRATVLEVELFEGEMSSSSRLQVLNGTNAAAIRSTSGAWEIVQFEQAEEIAADRWRLTGLLRGQLGTTDAMAAGAPANGWFVLLDEAVRPAGLRASEIGLTLNWRVGPSGADLSDMNFTSLAGSGGLRARLPLSPVHLRARPGSNGLHFAWIRRARLDADDWEMAEVPLDEPQEQYRLDIFGVDGGLKRSQTVSAPAWLYPADWMKADFAGSVPREIDVEVRQIGLAGPGLTARRRFAVG